MKAKFLLSMAIVVISFSHLSAQSADEDAVKKTVRTETESYFKRDTATWKSMYMQNEKITATYVNPNGYQHYTGWQELGVSYLQWVAKNPAPDKYDDLQTSNYIINVSGNTATAEYDQMIKFTSDSGQPYGSHEIRTLIKDGDDWKITSVTAIDTSYNAPANVEYKINAAGYGLLRSKRTKDAIDLFKMNVRLFPKSWNTYDSLGEAYMDDGNNAEAIKNYETSIKMNPQNASGKETLAKLKKK